MVGCYEGTEKCIGVMSQLVTTALDGGGRGNTECRWPLGSGKKEGVGDVLVPPEGNAVPLVPSM